MFLFTHFHFEVAHNEDRVIEINVSTDPTQIVDVSPTVNGEVTATFTYSGAWSARKEGVDSAARLVTCTQQQQEGTRWHLAEHIHLATHCYFSSSMRLNTASLHLTHIPYSTTTHPPIHPPRRSLLEADNRLL